MSPERHFEIIISGRQLAGVIALVAALVLVAFGLGISVGLMQPGHGRAAEAYQPPLLPGGGESVVARDGALLAPRTPAPAEVAARDVVAPPLVPADIAAATPPVFGSATPSPTAEPQSPSPAPTRAASIPKRTAAAKPTAAVRPTATPKPKPSATPVPRSWVQISSLAHADQAEGVRQRVIALGFRAEQVLVLPGTGGKYRVRLGPFPDQESAGRVVARLQASGFPDAFAMKE